VAAATIDVWIAAVPAKRGALTLLSALSEDERARAERFRHDAGQDAYITAHVLLRRALSVRSGIDAAAWRFEPEPSGRPRVVGPDEGRRFTFSLTHCTGLAACIVAEQVDVGIDAEDSARRVPMETLGRYFTARERAEIDAAAPPDSGPAFLRRWTLKEAYVKALGLGISQAVFADAGFTFDIAGTTHPLFGVRAASAASEWCFRSWNRRGYLLACAIRTGAARVEIIDHDVDILAHEAGVHSPTEQRQ
jgi:4'-phosphopantetheinyl transferase